MSFCLRRLEYTYLSITCYIAKFLLYRGLFILEFCCTASIKLVLFALTVGELDEYLDTDAVDHLTVSLSANMDLILAGEQHPYFHFSPILVLCISNRCPIMVFKIVENLGRMLRLLICCDACQFQRKMSFESMHRRLSK